MCFITVFLFQVAMRALGFEVKKVDVLKILKDYDREGTGKISFDDFKEVGKTTGFYADVGDTQLNVLRSFILKR